MEEGRLTFSTFELYVDKVHFEKKHMESFLQHMPYTKPAEIDGTKCQKVNIKYDSYQSRFLFISVHEGRFLPLSPTVFNKLTGEEHPNQRKNVEAEWNQQFYAVYDFEIKILYISNITKKGLFENIIIDNIFEKRDVDILISNVYKTPEDFMAVISKPKKISFARRIDKQGSLLKDNSLFDPKWAEGSESFFVELQYTNKKNFYTRMREFLKFNTENDITRLICVGVDDNNFEKVYRVDSFIEKISLDVSKNEFGLYEDIIVFDMFMKAVSK